MSVANLAADLRTTLLELAQPTNPKIYGPATDEAIADLEADLGYQIPDDLRELWGFASEGYWTLLDYLFSPRDALQRTKMWRQLLQEWFDTVGSWPSPDIQNFVSFVAPMDVGCLYLVDGPASGSLLLIDNQDIGNPTLLAPSLEQYLEDEVALVRARGVEAVFVPRDVHDRPRLRSGR